MSQSEYLITGVTRRPLMQGLQETNMALWEFEWVQKVIFKQQVEHGLKVFSP